MSLMIYVVHSLLLLTIATNSIAVRIQTALPTALTCTNVALDKTVKATTHTAVTRSKQQTNGMIDFGCLPDRKMYYPEVVVDLQVETKVSVLHIFVEKHKSTRRDWFHLRVGFRSWGDLEVGVKTKPSPLEMICGEYYDWSMSAIITIHCRHYAKSRYLVIQGIGIVSLPICEIKVYSDDTCENLALGKSCKTSDLPLHESGIFYPMTAVDGYKYELQKCIIFNLVSQKWWFVNLGQEYMVDVVNIYHQSFGCIVGNFSASGGKRKPIDHYAFFNVDAATCKWLCEGDASCTSVDVTASGSNSLPECYLHSKQTNVISRSSTGAASYTLFKAERRCPRPGGTPPSTINYAYGHSAASPHGRYLPHNVTMSIIVRKKNLFSTTQHPRCIDKMRYMASGVRSFTCKNHVRGQRLEITWSGSWKMGVCEIEVFGLGFPVNAALGAETRQSLGETGSSTSHRAVDGNIAIGHSNAKRGGYVDVVSVSLPTARKHWWQVELSKTLNVGHILIYSSVAKTLFDFGYANVNAVTTGLRRNTCVTNSYTKTTAVVTFHCNNVAAEIIRITNTGSTTYVRPAEVEVFEALGASRVCPRTAHEVMIRRADVQLNDTESHIVVAGQPFVLIASFLHYPNVTYTWWTNTTATATSNATGPIYRNGYPLTAGETYIFTVEAKSRICPQQIYSATFLLHTENSRVGHCIAITTEGREYATLFAVHCSGFVGEAASINYRYFVKNSSTHYKGATLYESPKSSMPPHHLFAGAELDNYKRIIYIKVVDRNRWIGTANVSIVVRPTDCVIEDMVDHVSSYMFNDTGDSVLDVLLASKDFQGGFSVMSDIANALNRVFSDTTYTTKAAEKLHKVRRMMISKLSNISDSDTGIVLDKAKCLNVITDTDYVEIEAQVEALVVYEDLGKYLKQMAYGKASLTIAGGVSKISQTSNTTAGLDTIEKPSKVVIDGVMKLMNRSTVVPLTDIEVDYSEDSFDSDWTNTDDEEKAAKRTIVRKAMTVAEYVSSALLRSVKPGSDNITMQTGTLNQVLKKDTAARLSQQLVKFPRSDGVAISFKLPTLENVTSAADVMGLQVFKLSRNPYMWHSSAKQVNSDVVGLSIYREDGQTVRLKNLTQPVVISIPRKLVTIGGILHVTLKMNQHGDSFSLNDLERFTVDVACNKGYQIILSPHTSNTYKYIFLIVKTDVKVFLGDFFRDSREERNITLLTVNIHNQTPHRFHKIKRSNNAGLEYVVEGRGVVSLFGRMSDKRPRCQLHIGLLPTFYDSSRCKLCEAKSKTCEFCNWETVVKTTSRTQIDSSKKTTDTFLNIATTVYTNDCLYWDENAEIWSNEGCKVSLNSSAAVIVCECRHLSVFSASMFVQPNSLDQFHMSLFLGIFNNPVVVALVIGAWCIYALLMMWARRKDHEDLKKQGVIFISTAVDAEYYYLITVMTGWQRDAGTSATVAMYMIGSLGVSETLVMADPTRFVHDSGAEYWFLVATTANFGRLLYLRVWHNCSGIFPSWFLKQITVRNIQTNQVWDFVCDDWLTPEFGVDGIKKSLFANENKRSRVYDFRLTSMQILRSEHPWISIFSRPVYKTFNCAQRLSCVMSFAMIAMLTNIMFYGKPPVDIEEGALGGIAITKEQLIVGIESFFICLPTSIIIVAIFTNIRPREKDNLCIEFDVLETRKSFWQTKDSIKKKDESVSKQEEFDDDLLITLRQIKPRMTPRVVSTGSLLATSATVSKFDIPISQVSNIEGDKIHEAAEKAKGCLPWWFIYIAYTVTLGTGIVSSFVTIMYSLTYGYARSVAFTVSFLSTFFQDTGIFEPMKITAAAAFVTFVTGARARPNVPDSYTLNRGMDEAFFSVDTNVVRRRSSSTSSHYLFPTDWTVRMAASVVINGHKLWKLLSDFSLSILLALLLTTILNYWTPASSYNVHKSLVDTFVRVRHAGNLTFTEVRTTDEMWRYIEHSFLPSLLLSTPHYVADDTNFVVGIARIRQLRVRAGPCSNSYGTRRSLRHSCFTPYSFGAEDKSSYSPSWHSIVRKNTNVIHQSPWTYRSADETSTTSTWGRYQTFSGGGYIIPVWSMRSSKMIVSLEKLRNASWVDEKTRAVFLEFTVFNPAANLFASTVLVFEFSDMGTIDPSYYDIAVYKLHMLVTKDDIYRFVSEIAYLIVINIYIVKTIRHLWHMRRTLLQYFSTIWTFVDWTIILLTLSLAAIILWRNLITMRISAEIREGRGKTFICFYQLIVCDTVLTSLLCALHFLLMMNVLRWSVFLGKHNIVFAFNISRARRYVFYIAFLFCVVFVMIVLTSQALFGSYCNGYKDFAKAVMHVASLFRYSDVCSMNECIHDSPYVSFLFFDFVAFFVVSMCRLQVLMCGITARCATRMSQQEKDDLQFVDYFMSRLLIHIGYWNMDDYVAHVTSQQQWRENNHPGFGQGAALSGTNLRPSPPTSRMEDPTLRPPPPTPCLEDPTVRPPPPTPRLEDPTLRPPPHNDPPTLRPPPRSDSASSRESAHHAGESLRL